MSAEIIDGQRIAEKIRGQVKEGVERLVEKTRVTPGLAVVLVGADPASKTYVGAKEKAAKNIGIHGATFNLPESSDEAEILSLVRELNQSPTFHGVLVQFPLPRHIDALRVISEIEPLKDVDGLHPTNLGLLLMGRPRFVPCTPAAIQRLLIESGNSPEGQNVAICGRSTIVGRPLSALLVQKEKGANATVTVCHTGTRDITSVTRQADILVAGINKPESIGAEMVKDGAVVVDVGIHRVEDPTKKKGFRLVGDVDSKAVAEKAKAITPVPGGVGPMTVAMLLHNTLKAAEMSVGRLQLSAILD